MIPLERHERILEYLTTHRYLDVEQAHTLLGASPATIRRDFTELAEKGLAQRTRGGLRRLDHVEDGAVPYAFRAGRFAAEKAHIAKRAMALLKPGDTVFVDGGTTTHHITRFLPDFPLTIITNSLRLATVLGEPGTSVGQLQILLSGGRLHPEAGLLMGPQAVHTLAGYQADWAFLSPRGIDTYGFYNTNEEIAAVERTMLANARKTAVLAHPGKFGRTALCRVAALDVLACVVAVNDSVDPLRCALASAGVALETTDAPPAEASHAR